MTITPVTIPLLRYEIWLVKNKNNAEIIFNDPRAIFGIVVAAVARKLVPKFSAPIVMNTAQNPVPNPIIPVER